MKKILGLDLGTNSIGWAIIDADENGKPQKIENAGVRIIPMDGAELGSFESGNSVSKTATRTAFRSARRLRERHLQRRERLHRVLHILGFLPEHYAAQIGWQKNNPKTLGKFIDDKEVKLAWRKINSVSKPQYEFLFMNSFNEMLADFAKNQPQLVAGDKKIPLDWTIYYLRKKALTQKVSKHELAWILLNFNQKRGYYQLRGEDEVAENKREFVERLEIVQIEKGEKDKKNDKKYWYRLTLKNGWVYSATFTEEPKWLNQVKEFLITEEIDENGNVKITKDRKKDKEGVEKRQISPLPSFDEIELMSKKDQDKIYKKIKVKTELTIDESQKTVGAYIYDTLLQKPEQKIRGKLVRTIERKYYRRELEQILHQQVEFHPELQNKDLYQRCLDELYQNNEDHRQLIATHSFNDLFIKDIIFYQRPLKSKKSLISNCAFEVRYSKVGEKFGVKCIAKSHPLFQEFRLWKFIANLKIYQHEKIVSGKLQTDVDVTAEFLKDENDYVALFDWLNDRKEIKQDILFKSYFKVKKTRNKEAKIPYRWNYVEYKSYPGNETRNLVLDRLLKANIAQDFLTKDIEESLWHILYSVEDKQEIEKALKSFALKHKLSDSFVENFKNCKPFKKEYGAFSAKGIRKLLAVMRMGKYWNVDAIIDPQTNQHIEQIIHGDFAKVLPDKVQEKLATLKDKAHFRALPEWLACYVVYGKFSEAKEIFKWETPDELATFIKNFKQHSLRNPIVEQVILETLRVVGDIWRQVGRIDEIHVELGREMKNPVDKRKQITEQNTNNENTNLRIKALLMELKNPKHKIENVRPYSPSQQEILKIYEEYALGNLVLKEKASKEDKKQYKFITKISKSSQPTKAEILRYKLWLEQKYCSPYTGQTIALTKLFTEDYEVEHLIPRSRYFDDSFSNKVICEADINKLKNNQLAYEFIKNHHGEKVYLSTNNKTVEVLSVESYEKFVKDKYAYNRGKMKKLLLEDIPESFIARQLNDTRYISKEIKRLLSNIVREKSDRGELEAEATSKNIISCTGGITAQLKKDWGLNDVWNNLILPRFERLNQLTGTTDFVALNTEGHKIPALPLALQKGFNKKRIDHRHHALDAMVIACATRSHVNYLNNQAAKDETKRYDLRRALCYKTKPDSRGNYQWVFNKPFDGFVQDVKDILENIVISFKQNLRIVTKATNKYKTYKDEVGNLRIGKNGNPEKGIIAQKKGDSWAIRKPLHKDTFFGKVNLQKIKAVSFYNALKNPQSIVDKNLKQKINELAKKGLNNKQIKQYFVDEEKQWQNINLSKIELYYFSDDTNEKYFATRKSLGTSFNEKKIKESVTDTGIQKILLNHLHANGDDAEKAFSPEGIEAMNKNIKTLNNNVSHQPIFKVRIYEQSDKFAVGQKGNKSAKFVEAAKGTNLFFAVYKKENDERDFFTVPLNIALECQKLGRENRQNWLDILDNYLKGDNRDKEKFIDDNFQLLFILSPNDLVYLPMAQEIENKKLVEKLDKKRIYKFTDSSGIQASFVPYISAGTIFSLTKKEQKKIKVKYVIQNEFGVGGQHSKNQNAITGEAIKKICIPIKVDRMGNITECKFV